MAARGRADPLHGTAPRDNARMGVFSRIDHLQTETDALYLKCQQGQGKEQEMTGNEMAEVATQEILRDLGSYEVLYDEAFERFVVASPMDESEGGRIDQPTAVVVGYLDEFEDVDGLVYSAKRATDRVDDLASWVRR